MRLQIDFMGQRHLAAAVSIVVVLGSLIALAVSGLNFGLDFTGGTLVEVAFAAAPDTQQVRDELASRGFPDASVQQSGSDREFTIRIEPRADEKAFDLGDQITALLSERHPGVVLERAEFVGPAVGEDLRESGALALLVALAVTGCYIAWRFTGKFAAAATIALLHDAIITLGAFAVFRWTFDLPSLAALLTVIGYSLNDTIVVCDRIRENLRLLRRGTVLDSINLAINQTLERTLIMSGTTLAVLLALLVFGGETLRGFSAALTIGVVVGTYSSTYIAAAYLVYTRLTTADLIVEVDADPRP